MRPPGLQRRHIVAALIAGPLLCGPTGAFASEAKKPEKAEKKKGGGLNFIQLPTLTANTMRSSGKPGIITVDSGLDIADGRLRAKAEVSIPRLRAAYVQILQTQAAGIQPGSPPNPDQLVGIFQRITDQVLGKPGAKFLIGAVMIN